MTLARFTWMLRCSECGWCATGYGTMPVHARYWVCGNCTVDLDMTPDLDMGVDLDLPI